MTTRPDLYQRITDAIVSELEKGVAPWVRPWKATAGPLGGLPYNGYSRRPYRGLNVWLLALAGDQRGYSDPRWFTLHQANLLGARVKKGEKSTAIIFWKQYAVQETNSDTGEVTEKNLPLLRSYSVFNAEQCLGIAPLPAPTEKPLELRYGEVKDLVHRIGVEVRTGGDQAFYVPSGDYVRVPAAEAFEGEEHYWGTVLHELVHATGHRSRLDRDLSGRFGSEAYAAEELVAEMGAAFMCGALGIEGRLRHPEYIGNWLKVLRGDKRAVFKASTLAQAAADFLLAYRAEEVPADEESLPQASMSA